MRISTTLFFVFYGVVFASIADVPVYAIEVQYTTIGTFNCHGLAGCSSTINASGDATVTVTDGAGDTSKLLYAHGSDDFTADSGAGDSLVTNFAGGGLTPVGAKKGDPFNVGLNQVTLEVEILQSLPSPSSEGDFVGSLTGKVSIGSGGSTSSTALITFAPEGGTPTPSITLDDVVYTLDNNSYRIAPGGSSIQGELDASALPEPAFFTLTGIGFFGMFAIAWSRYKQRA